MRASISNVGCYQQCPYRYRLTYIDGLETFFDQDPANALALGSALHKGIEEDSETAIADYYAKYAVIDDKNVDEAIKLEIMIAKAKAVLPSGKYEVCIQNEDFVGFADLLVPLGNDCYDLYDFKYTGNSSRYMDSVQLHVYKHYFEKTGMGRIRRMYFVFVPKTNIRLKRTESLEDFRVRLRHELDGKTIEVREVEYDATKTKEFMDTVNMIRDVSEYPKNPSRLCDWCNHRRYCQSDGEDDSDVDWLKTISKKIKHGEDITQLPSTARRQIDTVERKRIWLYGAPFSGKTYLANEFPNPLMLNTDGNIRFVDAPYIAIKDIVTTEGRLTKRTYAWEVFKDAIDELEKKQNEFKTIVVDLVEDTYEHCRQYMYNRLGIEHESDSGYGKGWDMIKNEFLNTMKRLMNLDYENIVLISHEDTSKDLTKKSGDKVTSVSPNLTAKASLKLAGMVDLVARVVNDGGNRVLAFKHNEYVFGGGRISLGNVSEIPCDYQALCDLYKTATSVSRTGVEDVKTVVVSDTPARKDDGEKAVSEPMGEIPEKPETPRRKRRVTE